MAKCKLCEQRRERREWAERRRRNRELFEKLEKLKNVSLFDDPPEDAKEERHLLWLFIVACTSFLLLGFLLGFVIGAYTASPKP